MAVCVGGGAAVGGGGVVCVFLIWRNRVPGYDAYVITQSGDIQLSVEQIRQMPALKAWYMLERYGCCLPLDVVVALPVAATFSQTMMMDVLKLVHLLFR